jgi:hypothetical protein
MSVAYNPKIVTNGLVLALDAGNTKSYPGSGTTWTDLSGRNNNATLIGGATYNSANMGSIAFDFINGVANINDADSLSFTDNIFTIDIWVYFNSVNVTQGVIGKRGWEYSIYTTGSNALYFYAWTAAGSGIYFNQTTIQAATWYNFSWVADGAQSILYVNSVPGAPYVKVAGTMSNTGVGLTVGRGGEASTGDAYMNGKVSNTKFYNRALSATEIQQNFNATRGRYGI